jgi:hypothetical protein
MMINAVDAALHDRKISFNCINAGLQRCIAPQPDFPIAAPERSARSDAARYLQLSHDGSAARLAAVSKPRFPLLPGYGAMQCPRARRFRDAFHVQSHAAKLFPSITSARFPHARAC